MIPKYIYVFLILTLIQSCKVKGGELECKSNDQIIHLFESKYKPVKLYIRLLTLQEEVYFPKSRILSIRMLKPTFSEVDFKILTYEDGFENYREIKSKIYKELEIEIRKIKEDCNLDGIDKIIIRIEGETLEGEVRPWLTLDYKALQ